MKYLFVASLVILAINASYAQTKLGLKLTTAIITQRMSQTNDSLGIGHGSNTFNPSAMLFADLPLSKNYYFSTGIGYIFKRVNLKVKETGDNLAQNVSYNVQYIQLPATLRLYTNEVSLDKKLYFQFGPVIDIAVHTKEGNNDIQLIKETQPIDISLLFGTGIEIQLAPQTAIQVGFSYSRGLINVVKSSEIEYDGLVIKNDLYGIDLAVKF